MTRRSNPIKTALTFLLPAAIMAAGAFWFFSELRAVAPGSTDKQAVTIPTGSGVRAISRILEDQQLIRHRLAFELAISLAGLSKDLQAGTFELSPSMSATEIGRAVARGKAVKELSLTFVEGWTSAQIGDYLEKQGIGTRQEFMSYASIEDSRTILPDERFDFLAGRPSGATLEGYLFPDTYRVFPDVSQPEVIRKMLLNFGARLTPELRNNLARTGRRLHDVITLASIVEREVGSEQDRRLVADIFWRRLAAGIALQSDATVNYVTGKSALQPTIADTEVDSPYNTYKYRGLPPGPIGNPGLASIKAAVSPESNPYFFFLTDSTGTVHYAKTFEEHLANKKKYLP